MPLAGIILDGEIEVQSMLLKPDQPWICDLLEGLRVQDSYKGFVICGN